jgi:DNA-binding CsgD family transcriptional regulator/tetratricopeptide (TPR) repeat protein
MALVGRNRERKLLAGLLAEAEDRGGSLIIKGDVGMGKSALLAEAAKTASAVGMRVLMTTGSLTERSMPFANLHQMLYPVRRGIEKLPPPQQSALAQAMGLEAELAGGPAPSVYLVGLATLSLLVNVASHRPVLVVVDDAHSLDRSSAEALVFVARRLESEPVVLIAALRGEGRSPLDEAGLPTTTLGRLREDEAGELLDTLAPALPLTMRSGVLRIADGNPLALTELATTGVPLDGSVIVPLTDRLESAFAARIADLPAPTRAALLLAALNDGDSVVETLTAANAESAVLAPAVETGLIVLEESALRFRHPLVRSAIAGAVGPSERAAAHRALTGALRHCPDRRLWHRASAATGPDETLAVRLASAAGHARHGGGAIAALEQAARLSENSGHRIERLLRAAELAAEAGNRDAADRLVHEVTTSGPSPRQRATATWVLSSFDDGVRVRSSVLTLAALAETVAAEDPGLAKRIVSSAALRCFWFDPGPEARKALLAAADRVLHDESDAGSVAISACLAPAEPAATVLARLQGWATAVGNDPQSGQFLGSAALQVGAFDLAAGFSIAAVPGLRAEGKVGLVARVLAVQAWSQTRLGDLSAALTAAVEASRLADETSQPYVGGLALAVQAEIAALRGDCRQAAGLLRAAEKISLAVAARPVLATAQRARALVALAEGRHDDALADLLRMFDPADPAYALALRCYVLPELADAARGCGRACELRELVTELEESALRTPSPALQAGLRYLRAVLAPAEQAERLFQAALEADLTAWALDRGRVQLAYGEWLRRQRRGVDARTQLRAARDVFDALGAVLWGDRARRELRALGEAGPLPVPNAQDNLTPHELSIAQLAAEGLTNREIGQMLFLSHRTVSTHLHRIFPKLGVSSRAELAAVLARSATMEQDG